MSASLLYDRLSSLLRYPDATYPADVETCRVAVAGRHAEVAAQVEQFAAALREQRVGDTEELFTRTFDINPVCSLEVGWHLFGEEYERGAFLVRMRQELRSLAVVESAELPDHLTHVLAILGRMDVDAASDFATHCVLPAVRKMVAAISDHDNPYEHVLRAVEAFLTARHGGTRAADRTHEPACAAAFGRSEAEPAPEGRE